MNEGQPGRLAAALIPAALAGTVLRQAACMRAHGYPGYPDPSAQDGGIVQPPLPSSIDTSSVQFQAALQKCNGG